MKKYLITFILCVLILIIIISYNYAFVERIIIKEYTEYDRIPSIFPDYTNLIIPYNIASLNFLINEQASKYYLKIYSIKGDTIKIIKSSPDITIPLDSWHELLKKNKGNDLYFEIYCKERGNNWKSFKRIKNSIADKKIDDFLVYRLIDPAHSF